MFSKRDNLKDFEQASHFQVNESKLYILLDFCLLFNGVTRNHCQTFEWNYKESIFDLQKCQTKHSFLFQGKVTVRPNLRGRSGPLTFLGYFMVFHLSHRQEWCLGWGTSSRPTSIRGPTQSDCLLTHWQYNCPKSWPGNGGHIMGSVMGFAQESSKYVGKKA